MANEGSLIPRAIIAFDAFIRTTNAYLILGTPTNAVRFGWTPAMLTAWQTYLANWIPFFTKYQDKKGQRSTAVTDGLHQIINQVVADDKISKYILKVKSTIGLVVLDCTTFNLPKTLASPATGGTHHATTIGESARTIPATEQVYVKLIPEGGGIVKCKCYKESAETGRAGKLKGFNLVEYVWAVFPNVLPTGTVLPTDASDTRLAPGHSTKANFLSNTGPNNAGKTLVMFFRWAKSKHPALDGPWSGPFTTTIL